MRAIKLDRFEHLDFSWHQAVYSYMNDLRVDDVFKKNDSNGAMQTRMPGCLEYVAGSHVHQQLDGRQMLGASTEWAHVPDFGCKGTCHIHPCGRKGSNATSPKYHTMDIYM